MNFNTRQRLQTGSTKSSNKRRSHGRHGIIIFGVLFFVFIGTAIILGTLSFSLRQQRQLARQVQAEQTSWLVDAGLAKAIDQLNANSEYRGETITVDPAVDQYARAEVQIVVSEEPQNEQQRIRVTAILVAAEGAESTIRKSIEVLASR